MAPTLMKTNGSVPEEGPAAPPPYNRIPSADATRPSPVGKRPKVPFNLRLALAVAGWIAVTGTGILWWLNTRKFVSTVDAFVEGRVIPIAAKVEGYVADLRVDDNQRVTAGEVLAVIDPRDYETAVAEAKAAVSVATALRNDARARLTVVRAQIDETRADLVAAKAEEDFSRLDAARYRALSAAAASEEDRERTGSAEAQALAKVKGAESRLSAAEANAREAQVAVAVAEAQVASAQARLRQPELNLGYTRVMAPQAGRGSRGGRWSGAPTYGRARRFWRLSRMTFGSRPISRRRNWCGCGRASPCGSGSTCTRGVSSAGRWTACSRGRAGGLACCPRKTRPGTSSRWCSGSPSRSG